MKPPDPPPVASPGTVEGALWMTGASMCFAAMIILLRIATQTLHPFEAAFLRNLFGLAVLVPWLARVNFSMIGTKQIGLHLWRSAIGLVSMLCWFTGLSLLPMAEATALSFTAPLFATIGAALVLGEIVRSRRWTATAIGFVGVMVVLRPGIEVVEWPALLILASAACGAITTLIIKQLSRVDSPMTIVTFMVLFLTPLSLIPAAFIWRWPTLTELAVMAAVGAVGSLGHLCFTRAMKAADASFVVPFDYVRLPVVALAGWLMFEEVMDSWGWIGALLILGSSAYTVYREAKLARLRRPYDPTPLAVQATKEKL